MIKYGYEFDAEEKKHTKGEQVKRTKGRSRGQEAPTDAGENDTTCSVHRQKKTSTI